jgi:predicted Fe-S protein YdhL (DUF1289 family)
MFVPSLPKSPVSSPCIGVCELDAAGLCIGCRRSGDEIAHWLRLSEAQRRHLMDQVLPARAVAEPSA